MIELNAAGYTALIAPQLGGSCVRLARFGSETLRTPETFPPENPFLYGTPMLFFPNRIDGGRFEFEECVYQLPVNEVKTGCFLHGTLHSTPFAVVARSENAVTLEYRAAKDAPYLTFPHAFTLRQTWTLGEDGLAQQVTFTNDSGLNMPVALAFHTTFRLPFGPDSAPQDMRLTLDSTAEYSRDARYLPDGGAAAEYPGRIEMDEGRYMPSAQSVSRFLRMGSRREMRLTDTRAGTALTYRAGEGYNYWMVVGGGENGYLCVEPQTWMINCPNAPFPREESGFAFLRPGESRTYETNMQIERVP